jgi:hypothetical protein
MPSVMSIEPFKQLIQVLEALGSVMIPHMQQRIIYTVSKLLSVTWIPPPSLTPLAPGFVLALDTSISSSNFESSVLPGSNSTFAPVAGLF